VERESFALRFWFVLLYLSSELPHGVADYGHVYPDESFYLEHCCDMGGRTIDPMEYTIIGLVLSVKSPDSRNSRFH
jgi:hypothetical protein